MSDRYFSSQPIATGRVTLDGPEAHHLLHVMRARAGDAVTLFDGSGAEFAAVIESLHRTEVELRIVERRTIDRELPFPLTVGVALPKGDRQKWLVEKLTELGAATLVPLVTERGVAQPAAAAIERLQRVVIEGAKQCGRNRLMQITQPQVWKEWIGRHCQPSEQSAIRNPQSAISNQRRLIAHAAGTPLREIDPREPVPTHLAIGPEGGLTDEEVSAAAAAGWQSVNLGPRVLRVETAAVALAAIISLSHGTAQIN